MVILLQYYACTLSCATSKTTYVKMAMTGRNTCIVNCLNAVFSLTTISHTLSIIQVALCCIIGRAGVSPPSLTAWVRCLYMCMVRPTGYRIFLNVSKRIFFTVTSRHFTGHSTIMCALDSHRALTGQGKPGFAKEENDRGSVAPLSQTRQGKPGFAEGWRECRASETCAE